MPITPVQLQINSFRPFMFFRAYVRASQNSNSERACLRVASVSCFWEEARSQDSWVFFLAARKGDCTGTWRVL